MPWQRKVSMGHLLYGFRTAHQYAGSGGILPCQFPEFVERRKKTTGRRCRQLDFNRQQAPVDPDDQVNLQAVMEERIIRLL